MLRVHCVVPEIRSGNHKQHDFVCDLPLTARRGYGGHSEGETPGPIPNPEAKPFSADGTAPATVWESRTPPDKHSQKGDLLRKVPFLPSKIDQSLSRIKPALVGLEMYCVRGSAPGRSPRSAGTRMGGGRRRAPRR